MRVINMEKSDKPLSRQEQINLPADADQMKEASAAPYVKGAGVQESWLTKSDADLEPVASLLLMGLKYAIKDYCERTPKIYFRSYGMQPALNSRLTAIVYRCTRELIDNALQHGRPQQVWVQLVTDDDFLSVTVRDDGIGFDSGQVTTGMGLTHITNAIEALGGRVEIHTTPGLETEVSIEIEDPQKIESV